MCSAGLRFQRLLERRRKDEESHGFVEEAHNKNV